MIFIRSGSYFGKHVWIHSWQEARFQVPVKWEAGISSEITKFQMSWVAIVFSRRCFKSRIKAT
jgi:hypothetical protein